MTDQVLSELADRIEAATAGTDVTIYMSDEVRAARRRTRNAAEPGIASVTLTGAGQRVTLHRGDGRTDALAPAADVPATETADRAITPPSPMDFGASDFRSSPDLDDLARQLCQRHRLPARDAVAVLWKRKGGTRGGKACLGRCTKTDTGLLGFYADQPFTIWLAADHVDALGLTAERIEALLFHELLHIGEEVNAETGERTLALVSEDVTLFHRELAEYGLWRDDLVAAKNAFEQARIPNL